MSRLILFFANRKKVVGIAAVAAVGLLLWLGLKGPGKAQPKSAELTTPALALRNLNSQSLYYNAGAHPWLLSLRPDLLSSEDKEPRSERNRSLAQAVQSPSLFRQLDRKYRFDALLLVGDPSQYRPLLDHLVATKDWNLGYLDHTSMVFRRSQKASWQPDALTSQSQIFPNKSEKAEFLALAVAKLLALRMAQPAKTFLEEAEALDAKNPEVWSSWARYYSNRGEWVPALESANRALALNPNFLPALAAKTQVLYSTKQFDEALEHSNLLVAALPNDPGILFYHAKIAHERHAYQAEAEALRKLIALAQESGFPTSGYRVYLGQSLATQGEAKPAIEQFSQALNDPDLPDEQRKFAEELLAQIKSRAGL